MSSADRVWFFGIGGSNAVAFDSYHKFLRSPIPCGYASDYHLQLMNAGLLTEKDCAFLISHTGLNKDTLAIARLAKENGAKLIVLTSYPLSPLAKMADIVLVSTAEEDYLALGISVQPPVAAVHHGRPFCDDHVPQ